MPPLSFVCSDRTPLKQGEIRDKPGRCFKKGLKAGFVAGIQKGRERGIQVARINREIEQGLAPTEAIRPRGVDVATTPIRPRAADVGISPIQLFNDISPMLTTRSIQTSPVPLTPQVITPPFTPSPQGSPWQLPPLPPGTPPTPGNIPRTPPPPAQPAPVEPMNITAGTLKDILGRDAYKEFRDELVVYRETKGITSKPQESYNKLGIEDYRILAQKILSNVADLSDVNRRMLNDIVNDRRIQGNKVITKTMIDSVITNIYRTRGGADALQKGLAAEYRTLLDPKAGAFVKELRDQMNYIVHAGDLNLKGYDPKLVMSGERVRRDFTNEYDLLAYKQLSDAYNAIAFNVANIRSVLNPTITPLGYWIDDPDTNNTLKIMPY